MTKPQVNVPVIWQPHPGQQTFALTRTEREILYGGARGGGKTDAAIAFPLRWISHELFRFLVIRRNADDLRDWIDRAKFMWRSTGAVFTKAPAEVRFPSGAKGVFGHLCDEDAYERYQGHEYQKMIIEELTHIPSHKLYVQLRGSNRSTVPGITAQTFATTNPGNAGHVWVRSHFRCLSTDLHNKRFFDEQGNSRIFVPAKVDDNPTLIERDPDYVKYLDSLPAGLREAWREGSWEDLEVEGAYYVIQLREAREQGRITNVPHEKNLPVHTWWDLGVGDSTAIGFFQRVGKEWRLIDYYEDNGKGLDFYKMLLDSKGYVYGNHYAPHDIEVRELSTGRSRLEISKNLGIEFKVVPNLPVDDGINAVRMRFNTLVIDQTKCAVLLDHLRQYRKEFNERLQVWRNSPVHDFSSHGADMVRYWAVTPEPKVLTFRASEDAKPYYPEMGL
jgi:hypothetical protein